MQYFVVHVIIQRTTGTLNFMDVMKVLIHFITKIYGKINRTDENPV